MKSLSIRLGLLLAALPSLLVALQLQSDTLKAWDSYIQSADASMQSRLNGQKPFLWMTEDPAWRARLMGGEIVVAPVNGHGTVSVTNGLIHDWIGASFIPNATIEDLFAVVHDYDRYKEFYKPVVTDSKVLACAANEQRFSMVWQNRVLLINAALEAQYQARDFALDGRRGYSVVSTTQVREFQDYGQSGAYLLPAGEGNGYIWRLHSIARYEERDGGVYFELEAIALTRGIPAALRFMVNPIVNRLSISSLSTSLRETREAVTSAATIARRLTAEWPSRPMRLGAVGTAHA